jgi:TRAP-type transport system periplasmic protein
MVQSVSRRGFTRGLLAAGGMLLIGKRLPAADFDLRQYHNQPPDSPLHKRLVEMWAAVKKETGGRVNVQTFPENNQLPGGDPAALKMLIDGELNFFTLNGGSIGSIVPAVNIQSMPFAFRTSAQVYSALDGDLGDYLREEMSKKGIYAVPRACFENGFHQITCSVRPIRTVGDLEGLKMRAPDSPVYVECWQALGAAPLAININKVYEALKNGTAEAQSNPLGIAELFKLYEVQKYVSLTNHLWTGFNLMANLKLWQRFPSDIQTVIQRNAAKYTKLERADVTALNNGLRGQLTQQGMTFNEVANTDSFRARLGPYYASWKKKIGDRAWTLLEGHVGKLG